METAVERADVVDEFINVMEWSDKTPEEVRRLVECNVRGFWGFLHSDQLAGCKEAREESGKARWHCEAVIRGVPVFVCGDDFEGDDSVGMAYGPNELWAIRRDDATAFELTDGERDEWFIAAADSMASDPSV